MLPQILEAGSLRLMGSVDSFSTARAGQRLLETVSDADLHPATAALAAKRAGSEAVKADVKLFEIIRRAASGPRESVDQRVAYVDVELYSRVVSLLDDVRVPDEPSWDPAESAAGVILESRSCTSFFPSALRSTSACTPQLAVRGRARREKILCCGDDETTPAVPVPASVLAALMQDTSAANRGLPPPSPVKLGRGRPAKSGCCEEHDHTSTELTPCRGRRTKCNRCCGCDDEQTCCCPAERREDLHNNAHEPSANLTPQKQPRRLAESDCSPKLEALLKELFKLQDLNANGVLEEKELIQLNQRIVELHHGKQVDRDAVKHKYRNLFREKLDPQGQPVSFDIWRSFMLEALVELDPCLEPQEMILEQFIVEAQMAREAFCMGAGGVCGNSPTDLATVSSFTTNVTDVSTDVALTEK